MKVGSGTHLPRIHVTWPHQVSIGAKCIIEHDIHFKFDGPWKPGPSIVVGDGTFIGTGCEFNCHTGIVIGKLSMIAAGCRFVDTDHGFADRSLPMMHQHTTRSPIQIADDVWVGANAVILKGITIGRGAIVGAGAVVTKSIPEFEIWGGVPAKKISLRRAAGREKSGGSEGLRGRLRTLSIFNPQLFRASKAGRSSRYAGGASEIPAGAA